MSQLRMITLRITGVRFRGLRMKEGAKSVAVKNQNDYITYHAGVRCRGLRMKEGTKNVAVKNDYITYHGDSISGFKNE